MAGSIQRLRPQSQFGNSENAKLNSWIKSDLFKSDLSNDLSRNCQSRYLDYGRLDFRTSIKLQLETKSLFFEHFLVELAQNLCAEFVSYLPHHFHQNSQWMRLMNSRSKTSLCASRTQHTCIHLLAVIFSCMPLCNVVGQTIADSDIFNSSHTVNATSVFAMPPFDPAHVVDGLNFSRNSGVPS